MITPENIKELVLELSGHREVTSIEFMEGTTKLLVFVRSEFTEDSLPLCKDISKLGFVTTLIESQLREPWANDYYYIEVFFDEEAALVLFVSMMLEHKQPVIIHDKA